MGLGLRLGVLLCLLISLVAVQAATFSRTNSTTMSIIDLRKSISIITVSGIPTSMSAYASISIRINIIHAWPSDLEIKLYNPAGNVAWIGDNYGADCPYYYNDILIADSYPWKIGTRFSYCSDPDINKAPQESFNSLLRYGNPNGGWRLEIEDMFSYDQGTLYSWSLSLEDGCLNFPCKNGGTCTATGTHTFSCACPTGLTGLTCETYVDACSSNPCSSNAVCQSNAGSYTCTCKSGYSGNGLTCTDVDECAAGSPCPANALCTNNQGSYTCACKPGYSGDGTTCTNINECSSNPCNTNANCTDTQGSYTCACKTGYSGNGFTCTNINECSTNPCSTNANCVDTQGSFTCTCKSGYSGNGVTCTDINECATGTPCDTNANCINTQGSFSCSCKTGYTGVGTPGQCADLNECSLGTHNCDTNANCANTQGSYTCSCKSGYEGAGTTGNCANINECTRGTYSCDANATCIDIVGSYSCMCKPGFSGSGAVGHCADINECFLGTFSCGQHALCSNTVGSYLCYCPSGFEGDGQTCTDVDECAAGPGPCQPTETCTNTVGSYSCDDSDECALGTDNCSPDAICTNTEEGFSCTCKNGYQGDGVNCTNINECGTNPCYANSVCADTIGSYNCICNPGFYKSGNSCLNWNECNNEGPGNNCSTNALCTDNQGGFSCSCKSGFDGDGFTCTDIDECSQQPYPCHSNATCSNSQGSYRCTCKPGFSGDGHSCTDLNECAGQNGGNGCDAEADCHNLPGSYSCACRTGFSGSGFNCTDVNECTQGIATCDPNSACSNTVGSYSCICNPGFYPNGSVCIDYNECANEGTQNQCSSDANCINTPGSYGCSCKSGYTGDGFSCADDDECALGEDNCDANAVCTNSLGSFGCTCLEKYVGDGVSCYLKPLPLLASRTSFSAVVEWESIVEASAYRLVVKNPSDTVVFDGYFGPGTGQAQVSSLAAFTKYTVELHTFALGNSTSSSERLSFTTDPAPLSALAIDSLTYRSITFRFQLSEGATEYLASISLRNGTFLRTRFLSVVELAGTKRSAPIALGTLDTLEANTGYNITVFAGTETTGSSIVFTSAPLAATNLSGRRYDDTGVKLQWRNSAGTTQNTVLRNDVNGTLLASYNMTSSVADMTYIVPGLQSGVTYQFVVYSGNPDGVDFSVGPSIWASTDTVFCDAVDSEGTTWDGIFFPSTQHGRCHEGYGGKPTRQCLITGQFGKIESPCVKLPDPLEGPIEVDAYSSTAIATWQREECKSFNAYMVVGDMEVSVNNGQGIGLTQPTITIGALVPLVNFTMKVYCGNEGGFERIGKAVSFMTNIPVPVVSASGVTASSVNLTWEQDSYAEWYRISYRDEEGEFTDLESRLQGTSLFVEDLSPAVNYTFRVYAGHQNTHEPHGTQLTVRTLGGSDKAAGGPLPLGAIVGIAIGGFLAIVLIVALVLVAVVFKQSKRTKQLKTIVEHERSIRSESTNQDNITLKRRQSTSSRRSSVADATLLNTAMEISVPGFLMLSGDQYRIEGPLGSGGAATVFRGTLFDPQLVKQHGTTEIAIKRIEKSPGLSEEENKERFLQEVSIMWSCTFHQNVVKLVGYSPQDSLVITKLYQMDLYGLVHHPTEQISSLLALKLAGDIASAMAYVQEIGIVHRDLKTSNVLLEEVDVGGGRTMLKAVVCDFGLARITSSATTLENLKLKEIGGFSPRYAAPEVFSAASAKIVTDAEQDKKSDVYSFAIIVWELLTRRVPWDGLPYEQIEYQVRSGARPVPPAAIPSDPAHVFLVELMAACWHESPGQRPPFGAIHTKISSLL